MANQRFTRDSNCGDEGESGWSAETRMSRRAMLRYSGGALVATMGGVWLTACGSSSSSSSSSSAAAASAPKPSAGALTSAEKQTLLSMAGPTDMKHSGAGMTWNVGGAFPFTGAASYYNTIEGDGLKLGVQHIAHIGGPNIKLNLQDIGSTSGIDPQKAVNAVLNFHDHHNAAAVSMGYNAEGAMNPGVARYKILSIDPGAGVGTFEDKPYFWGMRADNPGANVLCCCDYIKAKMTSAKKASLVFYTDPDYQPAVQHVSGIIKNAGFDLVGTANEAQGSTDYSQAITALRSQSPDFIVLASTGNDYPEFMKQYATSGINKPVFAVAYSDPALQIGGSALNNMYFAQENFLPDDPPNDWAKIFTKYYREAYPNQPSDASSPLNLSAAYYNVAFTLWQLAARVLAKGGDINSGTDLQNALESDYTFPSIFGGSGSTPGQIEFDPKTHGLKHEPFGVYQIKNQKPVLLATDDSAGGQLKAV